METSEAHLLSPLITLPALGHVWSQGWGGPKCEGSPGPMIFKMQMHPLEYLNTNL